MGRITEWEGRRKNGGVFPFELSLFEFRTPEGHRLAGGIRDISERREVERLKKEFVSTVSHELRTPLTSIRGSLGLLAGGVLGELPPQAAEVIAVAERNVLRLVRLINDILDLERFDSGRIEMHFGAVPLDSIFTRSVEAVRSFAEQEGVTLEASPTTAQASADGDRLVQVLVNLLSNAVKFSPRGGVVEPLGVARGGRVAGARPGPGPRNPGIVSRGDLRALPPGRSFRRPAEGGIGAGTGDLQGDHRTARRLDRSRERGGERQRVLGVAPGFSPRLSSGAGLAGDVGAVLRRRAEAPRGG